MTTIKMLNILKVIHTIAFVCIFALGKAKTLEAGKRRNFTAIHKLEDEICDYFIMFSAIKKKDTYQNIQIAYNDSHATRSYRSKLRNRNYLIDSLQKKKVYIVPTISSKHQLPFHKNINLYWYKKKMSCTTVAKAKAKMPKMKKISMCCMVCYRMYFPNEECLSYNHITICLNCAIDIGKKQGVELYHKNFGYDKIVHNYWRKSTTYYIKDLENLIVKFLYDEKETYLPYPKNTRCLGKEHYLHINVQESTYNDSGSEGSKDPQGQESILEDEHIQEQKHQDWQESTLRPSHVQKHSIDEPESQEYQKKKWKNGTKNIKKLAYIIPIGLFVGIGVGTIVCLPFKKNKPLAKESTT